MSDNTIWRDYSNTSPNAPAGMVRVVLVDGEAPCAVETDCPSIEEAKRAVEPRLKIGERTGKHFFPVWTNVYFYDEHGTLIEEIKNPSTEN